TALYLVCAFGEQRAAGFLIEHGSDVSVPGGRFGNPLQAALAYIGGAACIQALLAKGTNVNANSGHFGTALMTSLKGDNDTIVEILLRNEADPIQLSHKKRRRLHYACRKQKLNAVQMLLRHGADVN
ncbi:ankyrin, partial [Melanomma pulvis-pyrius CBS 109.77]